MVELTDPGPDPGGVGDQRLLAFPLWRFGDLSGTSEGGVPSGAQLLLLPRRPTLLPGGGHSELHGQHPVLHSGDLAPPGGRRGGLSGVHRHFSGPPPLRLALSLRLYPGLAAQDPFPQVFPLATIALGKIRGFSYPGNNFAPVAGRCLRLGASLVLQARVPRGDPGGSAASGLCSSPVSGPPWVFIFGTNSPS